MTHDSTERTLGRRSVLRLTGALTGTLALGAGSASAHEFATGSTSGSSTDGHDHADESLHQDAKHAELLDYHSLGDVGPSSETGQPEEPHYGGITEIRTFGDYAYVGIFSSDDPTNDRGMAILDVGEFNDAESLTEVRGAELTVLSFVRNDDPLSAVMDVKVSDDGEYVFMSKQPYTALFGETDPTPGTEGESTSPTAGSVVAVDVSDPENPRVVGSYDGWTTGPHNTTYHRVGETEYVFAVKDLNDGTAGLYVLEFDRTTGALVLVNRWTLDGDGGVGTAGTKYVHDITVQDDPRTGDPYGYLSYWDAGLRVLDLSDPTDIVEIGRFDMGRAHYAEPAPTLLDDTRVVIASQELSSQTDGTTGEVYLLDADGLDDGYDGSPNLAELDRWEWRSNVTFDDFTLSPHNLDVDDRGWVHLAHYHGGVRYLEIDAKHGRLRERGHYRPHEDVPDESKMQGLNEATPFTWGAVEQNGVTFAADINTGVYAVRHKHLPFGDDPALDVYAERADDGSTFTAGQTNQVDLTVAADEAVLVRDRVPVEWSVVGGDDRTVYEEGGSICVEFGPLAGGDRTYFAEAPTGAEETGTYAFGPVEYSVDGEEWTAIPDTTEENAVVGLSSGALGALGLAGTGGALYRFRRSLRALADGFREGDR